MKIPSILLLVLQCSKLSLSYQPYFHHNSLQQRQQAKSFLTPPSSSLNSLFLIRKNDDHNQSFLAPSSSTLSLSKLFSTVTDGIEKESSSNSNENSLDEEGIGAWIPMASISSMKGLGPQRVTLMNIDFVVWHTEEGKGSETKWTVQTDACAHRLAPLSQGRVDPETNCIECPYHGWQFDSNGNVTSIPQLDKGRTIQDVQRTSKSGSGGVNLRTYPTHIVDDLLFVFLPSSLHGEMFPQSTLPEEFYSLLNDERIQGTEFFTRDLPYSFDFLVENFMDPAHIPFAHHSLQSTRDDGSPIMMEEMVRRVCFFFYVLKQSIMFVRF